MGETYLTDIACPQPDFEKSQIESFEWLKSAYGRYQKNHTLSKGDYERLIRRVGVSPEQIEKRGYYLPDFHRPLEEAEIFQAEKFAGLSARQKFYARTARRIFSDLYQERNLPEHLIHVTCTGYVSPSAAQLLVAERASKTFVTHSYHMGCYGAFPALRMAQGFVGDSPSSRVDVVHTELCSLHMNPEDPGLEQILIHTLFADGAAVYRIQNERPKLGFELENLEEILIPQSSQAMAWELSESGFAMELSKDVPGLIAAKLSEVLLYWERKSERPIRSLFREAVVALHPGGPKIIESVRRVLELQDWQLAPSVKVLRNRGNMSSSTVPHVWNEILLDSQFVSGTPVISMAFGPGLTVAMSLMRVIR